MTITLIKKLSNKVFKDKNGKEHKAINYFLELENGKKILIKPVFKDDYKILDVIATKKN